MPASTPKTNKNPRKLDKHLTVQAQSMRETLANLRKLIKINGIINSADLNLGSLLNTIMKIAQKVMHAEASTLMLIDTKTNELVFEVARGKKGKNLKENFRLKMGQGIAGWVAQNEKPAVVPDVTADPRFYSVPDQKTGFQTRSIICVPLKVRNKTIGILQAINPVNKNSYSIRDLSIFKAFANQAAVAIENAKVRQYQLEEKRLKNELDIAHKIQVNFLPHTMPKIDSLQCWAKNIPARTVGGDLYDFLLLKNNHLAVLIGDVSGKGIPSALFMVGLITKFRFYAHTSLNPAEIFTRINHALAKESTLGMFATAALLIFDLNNKSLSYSNAGHFPPIIINKNTGFTKQLETKRALPLGIIKDTQYSFQEFKFNPKNIFVMYTDGVTETRSPNNHDFGYHRLVHSIKTCADHNITPKKIVEHLVQSVKDFAGSSEQHDDITVVSIGHI